MSSEVADMTGVCQKQTLRKSYNTEIGKAGLWLVGLLASLKRQQTHVLDARATRAPVAAIGGTPRRRVRQVGCYFWYKFEKLARRISIIENLQLVIHFC